MSNIHIFKLDDEIKQNVQVIYNNLCGCSDSTSPVEQKFQELKKDIQKQLDKEFFSNVKLRIKVEYAGLIDTLYSKGCVDGKQDIDLDVKIDSLGMPNFKIKASEDYLKEYVDRVKKDYSEKLKDEEDNSVNVDQVVEEQRQQTRKDLKELEDALNNKGVISRMSEDISALFSNTVVKGIEVVQVTQKVSKNVWPEGTTPESIWHSQNKDHENWPEYARLYPLLGGVVDGVVDNTAGMAYGIKEVGSIIIDDEKRDATFNAFSNIFTADGLTDLYNGVVNSVKETVNDPEKLQHWSGQKVTQMASGESILFVKLLKNSNGKGLKLLAECVKKKKLKLIHELREKIPDAKFREAVERLISKMDDEVFEALHDCEGFVDVLKDMASQGKKFAGGFFQLEYAVKLKKTYGDIKIRFEVVVEEAKQIRRYDISYGNVTERYLELKNWSHFYGSSFTKQFSKDLVNMGSNHNVMWKFRKTNGISDIKELKNNVLATMLKNQDDISKALNQKGVKAHLKKVFNKEIKGVKDFIETLNEDDQFVKIFSLEDIQ